MARSSVKVRKLMWAKSAGKSPPYACFDHSRRKVGLAVTAGYTAS
jgi:hypothetical protein